MGMTRKEALSLLISCAFTKVDELHGDLNNEAAAQLQEAAIFLTGYEFHDDDAPVNTTQNYELIRDSFFDCQRVFVVAVANNEVTFKTWNEKHKTWRHRMRVMSEAEFKSKYRAKP